MSRQPRQAWPPGRGATTSLRWSVSDFLIWQAGATGLEFCSQRNEIDCAAGVIKAANPTLEGSQEEFGDVRSIHL